VNYTNYFNKIFLLISIGMPGLQKLIIFLIIEFIFGVTILGKFSNDFYIVQFIIIFVAIGLSGIILVKLPKLNLDKQKYFISKIIYTYFLLTFFAFTVLFILELFNFVYSSLFSYVLLFTIGLNLLIRHYCLALKIYKKLIFLDLSVIFIFLLLINIFQNVSLIVSMCYLIPTIFFIYKEKLLNNIILLNLKDFINSLHISLVNLKLGIEYSAFFGTIFIISSIVVLIPMALSIYYLPILSQNILNKNLYQSIIKKFEFFNYISLISLFLFSILIYFVLSNFFLDELFNLNESFILYILFVLSIITSKLSLPISNIFLSFEKTYLMTKVNIKIIIFYFISYLILSLITLDNLNFIEIFLIFITLGNILRIILLKKLLKKEKIL
jgi:hypothetical protein